jgi:hypothetical protein
MMKKMTKAMKKAKAMLEFRTGPRTAARLMWVNSVYGTDISPEEAGIRDGKATPSSSLPYCLRPGRRGSV